MVGTSTAQAVEVPWTAAYRAIPSHYPPINLFETLYDDPDELELAYEIEGFTNDRLIAEVGRLSAVPRSEWVSGPGSSPIMAAFTHIGHESRFTDGSYGVYYAADREDVAIAETAHHKAKFLSSTHESDMELTMRMYVNRIVQPMLDIRGPGFTLLHHPNDYSSSQAFAAEQRELQAWGLLYNSVRYPGGNCAAVLRPTALTIPVQGRHLRYVWSGTKQAFVDFLEIRKI